MIPNPGCRQFVVEDPSDTPEREDVESYLRDRVGVQPRSKLKRAFLSGKVRVNGKRATRERRLKTGDVIGIEMNGLYLKSEARIIPNENLPLVVLARTPELVAVDKPAGQNAHPLRPEETDTALNALAARFSETALNLRPGRPLEGGLVHRIDSGTSGILLCARTPGAWRRIRRRWRAPSSEKAYLAWLTGALDAAMTVECWLAHDPKTPKRMRVSLAKPLDRAAWKAETSFLSLRHTRGATLALIRIHTGVTHQIRATAEALGHAVVGDAAYRSARGREPARLIHRKPLDPATRALLERLREKIALKADQHRFEAPEHGQPRNDGGAAGHFLLHALWLRVDGVAGLEKGLYCPPPDFFAAPK